MFFINFFLDIFEFDLIIMWFFVIIGVYGWLEIELYKYIFELFIINLNIGFWFRKDNVSVRLVNVEEYESY